VPCKKAAAFAAAGVVAVAKNIWEKAINVCYHGVESIEMSFGKNTPIHNQATAAVEALRRHYRKGAYRVIRDPEGVISLWAIEGNPNDPFSLSFVNRGRVYHQIEDVPEEMLKSFLEYVSKTVR
jgi:hypothetical protein